MTVGDVMLLIGGLILGRFVMLWIFNGSSGFEKMWDALKSMLTAIGAYLLNKAAPKPLPEDPYRIRYPIDLADRIDDPTVPIEDVIREVEALEEGREYRMADRGRASNLMPLLITAQRNAEADTGSVHDPDTNAYFGSVRVYDCCGDTTCSDPAAYQLALCHCSEKGTS
jgi:hypothetical protein